MADTAKPLMRIEVGLYQDDVKRVVIEIDGGLPKTLGASFSGRVVEIVREEVERA